MNKDIFIKEIKGHASGQEIKTIVAVFSQSQGKTVRGTTYLNLELGDRTGRINAKLWDATESSAADLIEGSVVFIHARLESYKGQPQLNILEATPLTQEQYKEEDFFRTSAVPVSTMKAQLQELIDSIEDPHLRRLVGAALSDPRSELFFSLPAAKTIHHAYFGGLLEHSLSVARQCAFFAELYGPILRRDLLLAGAILHDLGKCFELSKAPTTQYTNQGRLLGHIAMGPIFLEKIASTIKGFPDEKLLLLQHLMLAHHGELEKGSPVTPKLLEAVVLHYADELDARISTIENFIQTSADGRDGPWTNYNNKLGSHFMA
ncbi:MAG: HD domain-containing protein, partial [Deltaproteobacteria bacterium]|nr:HD domain-containing protein [Deltaproteobacteria bacterium]